MILKYQNIYNKHLSWSFILAKFEALVYLFITKNKSTTDVSRTFFRKVIWNYFFDKYNDQLFLIYELQVQSLTILIEIKVTVYLLYLLHIYFFLLCFVTCCIELRPFIRNLKQTPCLHDVQFSCMSLKKWDFTWHTNLEKRTMVIWAVEDMMWNDIGVKSENFLNWFLMYKKSNSLLIFSKKIVCRTCEICQLWKKLFCEKDDSVELNSSIDSKSFFSEFGFLFPCVDRGNNK